MSRDKIEIHEGSDDSEREQSEEDESDECKQPILPRGKTVVFENPKKQLKKKSQKLKKLTKKDVSVKRSLKKEKDKMGMVKPDITKDRDMERLLRRIATQGVVQLFNAVSKRQKSIEEELDKKTKDKEKLTGANFKVGVKEHPRIHFQKKEQSNEEDSLNDSDVKREMEV